MPVTTGSSSGSSSSSSSSSSKPSSSRTYTEGQVVLGHRVTAAEAAASQPKSSVSTTTSSNRSGGGGGSSSSPTTTTPTPSSPPPTTTTTTAPSIKFFESQVAGWTPKGYTSTGVAGQYKNAAGDIAIVAPISYKQSETLGGGYTPSQVQAIKTSVIEQLASKPSIQTGAGVDYALTKEQYDVVKSGGKIALPVQEGKDLSYNVWYGGEMIGTADVSGSVTKKGSQQAPFASGGIMPEERKTYATKEKLVPSPPAPDLLELSKTTPFGAPPNIYRDIGGTKVGIDWTNVVDTFKKGVPGAGLVSMIDFSKVVDTLNTGKTKVTDTLSSVDWNKVRQGIMPDYLSAGSKVLDKLNIGPGKGTSGAPAGLYPSNAPVIKELESTPVTKTLSVVGTGAEVPIYKDIGQWRQLNAPPAITPPAPKPESESDTITFFMGRQQSPMDKYLQSVTGVATTTEAKEILSERIGRTPLIDAYTGKPTGYTLPKGVNLSEFYEQSNRPNKLQEYSFWDTYSKGLSSIPEDIMNKQKEMRTLSLSGIYWASPIGTAQTAYESAEKIVLPPVQRIISGVGQIIDESSKLNKRVYSENLPFVKSISLPSVEDVTSSRRQQYYNALDEYNKNGKISTEAYVRGWAQDIREQKPFQGLDRPTQVLVGSVKDYATQPSKLGEDIAMTYGMLKGMKWIQQASAPIVEGIGTGAHLATDTLLKSNGYWTPVVKAVGGEVAATLGTVPVWLAQSQALKEYGTTTGSALKISSENQHILNQVGIDKINQWNAEGTRLAISKDIQGKSKPEQFVVSGLETFLPGTVDKTIVNNYVRQKLKEEGYNLAESNKILNADKEYMSTNDWVTTFRTIQSEWMGDQPAKQSTDYVLKSLGGKEAVDKMSLAEKMLSYGFTAFRGGGGEITGATQTAIDANAGKLPLYTSPTFEAEIGPNWFSSTSKVIPGTQTNVTMSKEKYAQMPNAVFKDESGKVVSMEEYLKSPATSVTVTTTTPDKTVLSVGRFPAAFPLSILGGAMGTTWRTLVEGGLGGIKLGSGTGGPRAKASQISGYSDIPEFPSEYIHSSVFPGSSYSPVRVKGMESMFNLGGTVINSKGNLVGQLISGGGNVNVKEKINEMVNVRLKENVKENVNEKVNIKENVKENVNERVNERTNITNNLNTFINEETNLTENVNENTNVRENIQSGLPVPPFMIGGLPFMAGRGKRRGGVRGRVVTNPLRDIAGEFFAKKFPQPMFTMPSSLPTGMPRGMPKPFKMKTAQEVFRGKL